MTDDNKIENSNKNIVIFSETLIKDQIKLDDKVVLKNYYSYSELENISENEILKLFERIHFITFISNIYLEEKKKKLFCFNIFKKKSFDKCKDIFFLPYEFKFKLFDIFLKNQNNKSIFKIVFDNGMIKKGVIYQRIIIQQSLTFIPINKIYYKLIEYKIRGFCQIVEELGASKIEIDFSHIYNKTKKQSIKSQLELQQVAVNLGFAISNNNSLDNNHKYILEYPDNNNLIINLNKIKKNLNEGKYLISIEDYNTNLELQYVINSRCRHFITNYSTNFKIINNNDFNFKTVNRLKLSEIIISNKIKLFEKSCNNILIKTNVIFNNKYRSPNNLLKFSVSADEVGFNFIMNNIIKKYYNIPDEWLVFIWRFINIYCYENMKIQNSNIENDSDEINHKIFTVNFHNIIKILHKIKENFSLQEIVNILKNYFYINSQMVNFKNFLYIIDYQTKTYDELGFFLLCEKNKILKNKESTINIVKFIISKEKNNIKIKEFLQVYNSNCYYQIYDKLNNFGIFNYRNWNSLNYLIDLSNQYYIKTLKLDINYDELYNNLYNNYIIGLSTFEFYTNIIPFIENILYQNWYKKDNLEIKDMHIILNSISEESFKFNNITNLSKLKEYLEKKITRFNDIKNIIEILKDKNSNEIIEYLKNNKNERTFIIKKILLIYKKIENINIKHTESFFYEILCFNEKLNIYNITLDKYGFKKIKINLIEHNFDEQYNKLWFPFIIRYFSFHYTDLLSIVEEKYSINKSFFKDFIKKNIKELDIETLINKLIEEIL